MRSSGPRSRSMVSSMDSFKLGKPAARPAAGRPHDRDRGGRGRRGARGDRRLPPVRGAERQGGREGPGLRRAAGRPLAGHPGEGERPIAESAASVAYQASNGFGTVGPDRCRCWTRRSPTRRAVDVGAVVSVASSSSAWAAAVLAPSGTCYWVKLGTMALPLYGTGRRARARPRWPRVTAAGSACPARAFGVTGLHSRAIEGPRPIPVRKEARRDACRRHRQRDAARSRCRTSHAPRVLPPRDPRAHRHQRGMRHVVVRQLHRAAGRRVGEVLHAARGPGRRPRGDHDRGPGLGRRPAPAPGRVPSQPRAAVRLLHAGHDHGRGELPEGEPDARRRKTFASRWRATSAAAPATRTS